MTDLIDRQMAIDAVCLNNYHDITLVNGKPYTRGYRDGVLAKENDCIENIMNLPPAQPERKWIPVSERLPKKDGSYFVSGKWASGKEMVGECEYKVHDGYFCTAWNFDVLAWQNLPEPYRAERRIDERD